ncbi:hypothetical protein HY214_02565 [Candidatus Roizmanbacteria bacterium]|nr:hypothetical protein [Candidatus Roizmanbacteria bacterium]
MKPYLAQDLTINGQTVTGPLVGIMTVGQLVNRIITFLFPLASLILLVVLLWGGYDYMTSQGSPDKIKAAQAKITSGIIGFILLTVSYLAVKVIAFVFGLGSGIL